MASEIAIHDFQLAVAEYRLAHGDPRLVISAASKLVENGCGGDGVVDLAGSYADDLSKLEQKIDCSFEELGLESPRRIDLAMWLTQDVARRINQEKIDPVEGARQIKRMVAVAVSDDGPWRSFAILADEWEETTAEKLGYEDDIRTLAKSLVGTA
jgi:hypothetical protein